MSPEHLRAFAVIAGTAAFVLLILFWRAMMFADDMRTERDKAIVELETTTRNQRDGYCLKSAEAQALSEARDLLARKLDEAVKARDALQRDADIAWETVRRFREQRWNIRQTLQTALRTAMEDLNVEPTVADKE